MSTHLYLCCWDWVAFKPHSGPQEIVPSLGLMDEINLNKNTGSPVKFEFQIDNK